MDAKMETVGGATVLRFERRFKHPVEKVWRAISDPAEMAHWFPAAVETELKIGAAMTFTFPGEAPIDGSRGGEILELDPPKVYAFRWNSDVLRFELVPDGDGCILYFSQTLGGGGLGRLGAGRNAAGWDHCLGALDARLDGREPEAFTEWLPAMQHYLDVFGLAEGTRADTAEGAELRFALDLVWKPVDDACKHVARLADTVKEGAVRWELFADPDFGTRVELTHTVPAEHADAELAAWPARLKELFAAVHAG
ncbi:SRPBCC family protein [Amycolatopsis alkalitolerans]|uniref:SRPBCC family protein n=1 Tax=Amycolatopsis alkalitolerans TaxID=2547244 RepID=A0A5C4LQE1_9PSEU|nr:SRPBCC family protein [Amycolatopsis alkalitolerans]TNC20673.1 SRPBCC family protein [Amycolatopsis alkalitolerans]